MKELYFMKISNKLIFGQQIIQYIKREISFQDTKKGKVKKPSKKPIMQVEPLDFKPNF